MHPDFGRSRREHRVELDRIEDEIDRHDTEREAEIAHAIDDKGLDRRGVGRRLFVPEADEKIGRQTDPFPPEEHLYKVIRGHQRQHHEGEQAEIGHEAGNIAVVRHIADRIDMNHRRHDGDHADHYDRKRIELKRPIDLQAARAEPMKQMDGMGLMPQGDGDEQPDCDGCREQDATTGDQLRRTVPKRPASEEADNRGCGQRREYG